MSSDRRYYYTFPPPSSSPESPPPSLSEVGGKALSLTESSAVGLPVPPGLVLTVSFFEPWLDRILHSDEWNEFISHTTKEEEDQEGDGKSDPSRQKELCDAIKQRCNSDLTLSSMQHEELNLAIHAAFGSDDIGLVAVRSSSPEEDLMGSSFAGGYDTTLGVISSTLEEALRISFSSCFDHRVVSYKSRHNKLSSIERPRIAVVIQRQIKSDTSGVAFGYNPSNNCFDEIMIGANFGLGETVVGGTVTPDTYIVDRSSTSSPPVILDKKVGDKAMVMRLNDEGGGTREEKDDGRNNNANVLALTDEQILEVAGLVTRVEESRDDDDGSPVDIEWAYDEVGTLHLLQARPVTAHIPLFPEMLTERGAPKRLYLDIMVMTQGFSDPLSVFGLDVWRKIVGGIKAIMSTFGKSGLAWNIHGRHYFNLSNMLKITGGHAMVDKGFRKSDRSIDRALGSIDISDYVPAAVPEGAKGILWKQVKELLRMVPYMFRSMWNADEALEDYIRGSDELMERCYEDGCSKDAPIGSALDAIIDDFTGFMPGIGGIAVGMLSRARVHKMFSQCEEGEELLISLCMDLNGNPTSEMGHAMVKLAEYPEIQNTSTGDEFVQKLKDNQFSKEFTDMYHQYLKKFGCRGIREIDAATPRSYERQEDIFDILKQIDIHHNQIKNVSERREQAYQKLLRIAKDIGKEKAFKYHANLIQRLLGYREHPKFLVVQIVDRMRRHALHIGEEFVLKGRLQTVTQIFDLTLDQIAQAQSNTQIDLFALITANLDPYKKVENVKQWPVLIDSRGKILRGTRDSQSQQDGVILGDPISPGVIKGKAKVLNSPYEKPLLSGEILVARFTEPSWTPLFINAAAIVMEIGGPMQHGAIIAREYGIPCVSGVMNATTIFSDGDLLEVDGSAGTVVVHSSIESEDKLL